MNRFGAASFLVCAFFMLSCKPDGSASTSNDSSQSINPPSNTEKTAAPPPTEGTVAIPRFWSWFERNSERLSPLVRDDSEAALDQISYELRRIDPDLLVEIGIGNGFTELIVSAGGLRSVFPHVQQTVSDAPMIEDWRVIAFRQPKPDFDEAITNGTRLRHSDVKFVLDRSTNPPGVTFYVRGLQSQSDPKIGTLFFLIDNLIGEYNTAMRIGAMVFRSLSDAPNNAHTFPKLKRELGL